LLSLPRFYFVPRLRLGSLGAALWADRRTGGFLRCSETTNFICEKPHFPCLAGRRRAVQAKKSIIRLGYQYFARIREIRGLRGFRSRFLIVCTPVRNYSEEMVSTFVSGLFRDLYFFAVNPYRYSSNPAPPTKWGCAVLLRSNCYLLL
jgi:hypothetical protein